MAAIWSAEMVCDLVEMERLDAATSSSLGAAVAVSAGNGLSSREMCLDIDGPCPEGASERSTRRCVSASKVPDNVVSDTRLLLLPVLVRCEPCTISCCCGGICDWLMPMAVSALVSTGLGDLISPVRVLLGRGALKSWTLVPLIRGSYEGSAGFCDSGRGRISGTFCEAFRRMSRVDMGFFRNGKPFFPFCVSADCGDAESMGGSEVSLVPAGLFPAVPALLYVSVGEMKGFDVLACFTGTGGGRVGGRFVFIGGGDGRSRGASRISCTPGPGFGAESECFDSNARR